MTKNISVKQSSRKLNDIVNYIFLMLDMPFRNWAWSSNRALDTKAYYMYSYIAGCITFDILHLNFACILDGLRL